MGLHLLVYRLLLTAVRTAGGWGPSSPSTPPATTNPAASNPAHHRTQHETMSRDMCSACPATQWSRDGESNPGPAHYERAPALHENRGRWRPPFAIHGRDLHKRRLLATLQLATGSRRWRLDSVSCVTTVSRFGRGGPNRRVAAPKRSPVDTLRPATYGSRCRLKSLAVDTPCPGSAHLAYWGSACEPSFDPLITRSLGAHLGGDSLSSVRGARSTTGVPAAGRALLRWAGIA
jgi:hypothetical protein